MRVRINRAPMERVRDAASRFDITAGDMAGPVLVRVGQVHRKQEAEVFSTQGGTSIAGRWAPLSPDYAKAKRAALGAGRRAAKGKKGKERRTFLGAAGRPISMAILVWSGDMKDRFLRVSRPEYVQQLIAVVGQARYLMRFGAQSDVASYHRDGGPRLPARDMITKTAKQILELQAAIVDWYRNERVPQALQYVRGAGSIGRGAR